MRKNTIYEYAPLQLLTLATPLAGAYKLDTMVNIIMWGIFNFLSVIFSAKLLALYYCDAQKVTLGRLTNINEIRCQHREAVPNRKHKQTNDSFFGDMVFLARKGAFDIRQVNFS